MVYLVIRLSILALVLGLMTHHQAERWRSERSLWESAVWVSPEAPGPHLSLGIAYQHLGLFGEASEQYRTVLRLSHGRTDEPIFAFAVGFNLAKLLTLQRQFPEAMAILDHLESQFPENIDAIRYQKASLLQRSGSSCSFTALLQLPCLND